MGLIQMNMRLIARILATAFALSGATACISPQGELPAGTPAGETRLSLVLICDIYKMSEENGRGGMARVAAAVGRERERGGHVLVAHAGDTISPSLMSGFDQGAHMIDLINQLSPDVFVPGNHEFDFGPDVFLKRMGEARFPIFAANLREANGRPIKGIQDGSVLIFGEVKVGVIGLTADDSPVKSLPGRLKFEGSLATAKREAARLRGLGADLIVLVAHAGRAMDQVLFDSGVADVILSGDDHDLYLRYNEKTAIIEAAEDGRFVGVVDLSIKTETRADGSRKVSWRPRFRLIDTADVDSDAEMQARVAQYEARLNAELGEPIATLKRELDSRNAVVRGGEAAIGNLFADALRAGTKADVALINGGGFRGGKIYPAGTKFSRKDVLTELPFLNKALVLDGSHAERGFGGRLHRGRERSRALSASIGHARQSRPDAAQRAARGARRDRRRAAQSGQEIPACDQ
jgi:5'-nucleotidase / UDP-sugar diphosphatase